MITGTVTGIGQQVKRIEYYPNGQVKQIEYYEPVQAAPVLPQPWQPTWPQPSQPYQPYRWERSTITWGTGTAPTTGQITVS